MTAYRRSRTSLAEPHPHMENDRAPAPGDDGGRRVAATQYTARHRDRPRDAATGSAGVVSSHDVGRPHMTADLWALARKARIGAYWVRGTRAAGTAVDASPAT